jgi:hypothetical protein
VVSQDADLRLGGSDVHGHSAAEPGIAYVAIMIAGLSGTLIIG